MVGSGGKSGQKNASGKEKRFGKLTNGIDYPEIPVDDKKNEYIGAKFSSNPEI